MKQHNHPIQRSGLTKAIVIALSICSLSSTNKADAGELNTDQFITDVKTIHLSPDELCRFESITDVRNALDNVIDYDRSLFSKALDEICNNTVGNTMFKLLLTKLPPGNKIKITDIGPKQTLTGEAPINQKGSSYLNYGVKINLNVYDSLGIGIPERQYYYVDGGKIDIKLKSMSGSIFHEFTHCLHHIEDGVRYDEYSDPALLPDDNPWDDKEERRTISGYIEADSYTPTDVYDPICDNCYALYKLHIPRKATYLPRLGHVGYVEADKEKRKEKVPGAKLENFCKELSFDLAWPKRYVIS